jgi:hypothetical protein
MAFYEEPSKRWDSLERAESDEEVITSTGLSRPLSALASLRGLCIWAFMNLPKFPRSFCAGRVQDLPFYFQRNLSKELDVAICLRFFYCEKSRVASSGVMPLFRPLSCYLDLMFD